MYIFIMCIPYIYLEFLADNGRQQPSQRADSIVFGLHSYSHSAGRVSQKNKTLPCIYSVMFICDFV